MSLNQKLSEFFFNLETIDIMKSLGRSRTEILKEMKTLNFSESLLDFHNNSRNLFNSVVLRLRLYSEKNLSESSVRDSLSVLNNNYVDTFVNYLYSSTSLHEDSVEELSNNNETIVEQPKSMTSNEVESEESVEGELEEDEDPFETFFDSCVE